MSRCHHHHDRCREPERRHEGRQRESMFMVTPIPSAVPIRGRCIETPRGPVCMISVGDCRRR